MPTIEDGLTAAGYKILNENVGIVLNVNLYHVGNVAKGHQRSQNELGALLRTVTGYELTKGAGGISSGSDASLGAIADATLQDVIRSNNEYNTYVVFCDVNTYDSFAITDKVTVSVDAGDKIENRARVMQAIQER